MAKNERWATKVSFSCLTWLYGLSVRTFISLTRNTIFAVTGEARVKALLLILAVVYYAESGSTFISGEFKVFFEGGQEAYTPTFQTFQTFQAFFSSFLKFKNAEEQRMLFIKMPLPRVKCD